MSLSTTAPDRRTATLSRPKAKDATGPKEMLLFLLFSEATMSAHAFEVLSRARNEIEVCHTAEGHRFKFFVITNAHGKRILSESVEVVAKEGATHTPEFFPAVLALSPSRWPIGLTQLIEFICVDGATEVEMKEKKDRVEGCAQRNRGCRSRGRPS